MDYQIKELMKQGLSRNEIFEQLKKQSGNQMRLAQKIATFILTIFYFVGLFKKSFTGYASFILFCVTVAVGYVYFFNHFPVVSILGVLLAVAGGALSYTIKVRLFPHMGFMDVRKDENGMYIFE
ncbi:MAG: hypothetical protein ABJM19_05535 [Marinobacter sp.]|uniref:hypothetical protein n=1 Tax=Marinobacter sp. TaxID=50741 RepID=UPI00329842C0